MDAIIAAKQERYKLMHIGAWQWGIMFVAATVAGAIAYFQDIVWVVLGPLISLAAGIALTTVLAFALQYVAWLGRWIARSIAFVVNFVAVNLLSTENYEVFSKLFGLWDFLAKILYRELPRVPTRLFQCTVFDSVFRYAGWYVLGHYVLFAIQQTGTQALTPEQASRLLDVGICLWVICVTLQSRLQAMERELLETTKLLPRWIDRRLAEIKTLGTLNTYETLQYVAMLRDEVRRHRYNFRSIFNSGYRLFKGLFGAIVLVAVLSYVSVWGGLLVGFAMLILKGVGIRDLIELAARDAEARKPEAELEGALRDVSDSRTQILFGTIVPKEDSTGYLEERETYLDRLYKGTAKSRVQRTLVAMAVYFTLYLVAAWLPMDEVLRGTLETRVGLLFLFSLIAGWSRVTSVPDSSAEMVESFDQFHRADLVYRVLTFAEAERKARNTPGAEASGASVSPPEKVSSEITIEAGTCFGGHIENVLFRFPNRIVIPATTSIPTSVKVLADPESGATPLMMLMAGKLFPLGKEDTRRTVRIGGDSTADVDMSDRAIIITEHPPEPSNLTIGEWFRMVDPSLTDEDVESILTSFDILTYFKQKGVEYSGAMMMLGYDYRRRPREEERKEIDPWRRDPLKVKVERGLLDAAEAEIDEFRLTRQRRLIGAEQMLTLWLARQWAALNARVRDETFNPAVILVDGIGKIRSKKRRDAVYGQFRDFCVRKGASMVSLARGIKDLEPTDLVMRIIPFDQIPADYRTRNDTCSIVLCDRHGALFGSDRGSGATHNGRLRRQYGRELDRQEATIDE